MPSGETVFTVSNRGKVAHDFWIADLSTPLISPGESTTLTVTLAPGTSTYLCTVAGHAAAGMKGTLKVQ